MPLEAATFTLSYTGKSASQHAIDLYDVSYALLGFQRSLALTTHLVLNGEIITQAPALKGAEILTVPPKAGSWEIAATILTVGGALLAVGKLPTNTPLGHLISSVYDYVISETLGFHVDYSKSLGQQFKELKEKNTELLVPSQTKLDALIEKCEVPIKEMHRPIVWSETASKARISVVLGSKQRELAPMNRDTYEHIHYTDRADRSDTFHGRVSSYNINTFKGRIFIPEEGRPIPFELSQTCRGPRSIGRITSSLQANAQSRFEGAGDVLVEAFTDRSRSGRIKNFHIVKVSKLSE